MVRLERESQLGTIITKPALKLIINNNGRHSQGEGKIIHKDESGIQTKDVICHNPTHTIGQPRQTQDMMSP